ncbi:MAG: N-acetylmuramoyl-L-alanine amidase [Phycisphaerae bacterium]|nr:N-acetylmuramoyl-L-alanine amidase [Phycisphaerae bacterium]
MRLLRFQLCGFWIVGVLAVLQLGGCVEPKPLIPHRVYPPGWKDGVGFDRSKRPPSGHHSGWPNESLGYLGSQTIIIDPGHGAKDPGTQGLSQLPEKAIVLAIGKELDRVLRLRGAQTVMTRSGDRFIELDRRASIAEENRAALLVSIHVDYTSNSSVQGATVLIGRTASRYSKRPATTIKAALERSGISVRSVRPQNLRVLEGHSRPAVLIECGFLSNGIEARNLNTTAYQQKVAYAIADGISDYFKGL